MSKAKQPSLSRNRQARRLRLIVWIIAGVTAAALLSTILYAVVSEEEPIAAPTPSDQFRPELVGVPPQEAGCKKVERPRYQGHIQVQPGEKHPPYSSNPPSSGWYLVVNPEPAWYEIPLPTERIMAQAALGGVIIWSSQDQAQPARRFTRLAQTGYLLGTLWPSLKSGVVFTAWGVYQHCEKFSGAIAAAFMAAFHQKALKQVEPKATPFV